MITALLGTKIGQSQAFTESGKRIPVTLVAAGPCRVTQIRMMGSFTNIQLAYGTVKHTGKAMAGHIKSSGLEKRPRFLRTVKVLEMPSGIKVGALLSVADVFAPGDAVRVTGTSKGKGFAGVVKRHGFAGGPRTHGQSDKERAPGSIGQTTTPGRVYKGKRMAGRMGGKRVTVGGLSVFEVDKEKNILKIRGLVPGAPSGLLIIRKNK